MSDPFAFTPGDGFFNYGTQPDQNADVDPNANPAALTEPSSGFLTNSPPVVAQPDFSQALLHAGIGVLAANEAGQGASGLIASGLQGYSDNLDQQYARQRQARQDDLNQYSLLGQIQARQNAQLIAARRVQAISQLKQSHPELGDLADLDPSKAAQILADQQDPVKQAELAQKQADLARVKALQGVFTGDPATASADPPTGAVPLSVQNNNPGNMKDAQGNFHQYATPADGMAAMQNDLATKIGGGSQAMTARFGENYKPTLANVITTWAPPTENDTAAYIKNVSDKTGIAPDQVLTQADIAKITPAMIHQEGGNVAANVFGPIGNLPADPTASSTPAGQSATASPSAPVNPYAKRVAQLEKASQIDPEHFSVPYDTVLKASTEWDQKNGVGGMNEVGVPAEDAGKTGMDLINAHPNPAVRNRAAAMMQGREPFPTSQTQKNPITQQALQLVEAADPSYSAGTAQARVQAQKTFGAGGKQNQVIQNLNTLGGHIADATALVDQLPDHAFTLENSAQNFLAGQSKNPLHNTLNKFNNLVANNIAPEGAKIAAGTGEATDHATFSNVSGLSPSQGRDAIKASLQSKAQAVADRSAAILKTYSDAFGQDTKPPGWKPYPQATIDAFAKLGVTLTNPDFSSSADTPPASPKATAPTGIPAPKTQADYDAIPSGSTYTDTDGTIKRKK